jgi:predicted esterase
MNLKTWLHLSLLFSPVPAPAWPLHFGTNEISPHQIIHFTVPLNARARSEASRLGHGGEPARGVLVLPAGFDLRKPCPLLIVSVPSGGSAIGMMRAYTNVALKEGWAVLAADGPRVAAEDDTIQLGWAMLSSVLDQATRTWPPMKQWPAACAGFSGGAKRSAAVGAAMAKENFRVIGIFMGGCNEDRATLGYQLFRPGDQFKNVPLFLSNGTQDPIANPQHAAVVRASMELNGFKRIRSETYEGSHGLDESQLRLALQWFRRLSEAKQ